MHNDRVMTAGVASIVTATIIGVASMMVEHPATQSQMEELASKIDMLAVKMESQPSTITQTQTVGGIKKPLPAKATTSAVASHYGVNVETVRRWVKLAKVEAEKRNGVYLVKTSTIPEEFLRQ